MLTSGHDDDTDLEWRRLHADQLRLRGEIADETDPDQREALLRRLERNRAALAEISTNGSSEEHEMAANETTHGEDLHGDGEGGEGSTGVDELFDSLGLGDEEPEPSIDDVGDPVRSGDRSSSRMWALVATALGVGLLVIIAAAIWNGRSSSNDVATAADAAATANSDEGAAADSDEGPALDLEAQAAELRETLRRLGFEGIGVDVGESDIQLVGSVPTEQDLSAIRTAITNSFDPATIDLGQVVVGGPGYNLQGDPAAGDPATGNQAAGGPPPGGQPAPGAPPGPGPGAPPPGAPPPGFVPPTEEQMANLQAELNRVLTETPLVFDVGSTELNQLQLKVLDTTVIGLLEAHPGVPVRLVGYTDETGGDFENSILSFDRATAVSDYLVSRGVPQFILRVEGRGEDDTTGDAGADRRVEIEVIENPFG